MGEAKDALSYMRDAYREAEVKLARGQWPEATDRMNVLLLHGETLCHSHAALSSSPALATAVSSLLLEAGKKLNVLYRYDKACLCFSLALQTLADLQKLNDEQTSLLCLAFNSHFQTLLYTKEMDQVVTFLETWKAVLGGPKQPARVGLTLGAAFLELGTSQMKKASVNNALESFRKAQSTLSQCQSLYSGTVLEARLLSSLGACLLCNRCSDEEGLQLLRHGREVWRGLGWPLEEADALLTTVKHVVEAQLVQRCLRDDGDLVRELLGLHDFFFKCQKSMQVADTFTHLGIVAFQHENEKRAVAYFEQSLALFKQVPRVQDRNLDEIMKLLRFLGVACYNCRDFQRAAAAYHECLDLLEQQVQLNATKLDQVAECCASLGFTYSRLRHFDNMLEYYERALGLKQRLSQEDLQLIETNIGSLYHVKAVTVERRGRPEEARALYARAEDAFTKALAYSWKSFPFINYGYYLYCRGRYALAADILHQGYHNSVLDQDTVEFDHTEDPILIDDLRLELDGREDIRLPAVVISLYLRALALVRAGEHQDAALVTNQLSHETDACKFESYYHEAFGLERMAALSYSLLGYAFRALDSQAMAAGAFQKAIRVLPGYTTAKANLQICVQAGLQAPGTKL